MNTITTPPFTTTYEYDLQGRLIASTSPDGGRSEFVYRKDGKIRFSQNAVQRNANGQYSAYAEKFSYTNYDDIGRPVESGEYLIASNATKVFAGFQAQDALLENTDPTNSMLPAGTKLDVVNTVYDAADPNIPIPGYTQDEGFLKGAVSSTSNANSQTWYNYDDHGRVVWTVKSIGGFGAKSVDYTYNAQGNVTSIDYQRGSTTDRFTHYYDYDADGRLVKVQISVNGGNKTLQAQYYYYIHGPLKRVELGTNLQGIDYTYTPQGWLKTINHPSGDPTKDPNQDGVNNSFAPDAFGMQLDYFNNDYTRTGSSINSIATGQQTYYNGNVSGLSWQSNKPQSLVSTQGAAIQNPAMYQYNYDNKYQLLGAKWGNAAI